MDQTRLQELRQLVESTTLMPSMGFDWTEITIRTDDAHRKQDFRLHHECRGIILELLDETERLSNPTAHDIYAAATRQVVAAQEALDAEEARIRWAAHGGYSEFMDG